MRGTAAHFAVVLRRKAPLTVAASAAAIGASDGGSAAPRARRRVTAAVLALTRSGRPATQALAFGQRGAPTMVTAWVLMLERLKEFFRPEFLNPQRMS
jgi:hypothetical protein